MTSQYENDEGKAEGKTLDALYYAVRLIDSKVEEILDELKEHFEKEHEADDERWDLDDYYRNNNDCL